MKSYTIVFISILCICSISAPISSQWQSDVKISRSADVNEKSYTGIIQETFPNGKPKLWKHVINGKAEGQWLEWYPNGELRYRASWRNGMGHGLWEYFYDNGQLRYESFYLDDIGQGMFTEYHKNGKLSKKGSYWDNKLHGKVVTYDKTGELITEKKYARGIEILHKPTLFLPGIISSEDHDDWGFCFDNKETTIYFTRRIPGEAQKIYMSEMENGTWSTPVIAEFSTDTDENPWITSDGKTMYFNSFRPLEDGSTKESMDMNLWKMTRTENGWSKPVSLPSFINKSMTNTSDWPMHYEASPTTDEKGNLYYWTKSTKTKGTNIYVATIKSDGEFATPTELIEPSDHNAYDTSPVFSPDGNYMFFSTSNKSDGFGQGDIYYSRKVNGKWTKAKNLGPTVNSRHYEGRPNFSADGKYFYFSSMRNDNLGIDGQRKWDIYYMESAYLLVD